MAMPPRRWVGYALLIAGLSLLAVSFSAYAITHWGSAMGRYAREWVVFALENIDRAVFVPISGGLAAWVGWGWRSWIRRRPEQLSLGMRCSLGGFVLASVSAALEIGSGIYAWFFPKWIMISASGRISSFLVFDPYICRWGFLLASLGLVTGLFGVANKTPLRWKAPALSTVLLLVFFVQLLGQPIACGPY